MCFSCRNYVPDILNQPLIIKVWAARLTFPRNPDMQCSFDLKYASVFFSYPSVPFERLDIFPSSPLPPGKREHLIKKELESWRLIQACARDPMVLWKRLAQAAPKTKADYVRQFKGESGTSDRLMIAMHLEAEAHDRWLRKGKYRAAVQP